jgi:hypothetical protein
VPRRREGVGLHCKDSCAAPQRKYIGRIRPSGGEPAAASAASLVGRESLPEQNPRPLPDAVKPLVQWIHITSKEIKDRRGLLLKNGKAGNCGLPKAPEW